MTLNLQARISRFLNDAVFSFVEAAQRRLKTHDLVVVLDLNDEVPSMAACPRQSLKPVKGLPKRFREKLSQPASDSKSATSGAELSFWFMVLDAGRTCLYTVNATRAPFGAA